MSFPRHEGIFRSDGRGSCRSGARSERLHAPTHRLDEFPTGYSSAGWSPPEPASASPAEQKFTMKAAPQPSLFQRMGKPCLAGCLTTGVHPTDQGTGTNTGCSTPTHATLQINGYSLSCNNKNRNLPPSKLCRIGGRGYSSGSVCNPVGTPPIPGTMNSMGWTMPKPL